MTASGNVQRNKLFDLICTLNVQYVPTGVPDTCSVHSGQRLDLRYWTPAGVWGPSLAMTCHTGMHTVSRQSRILRYTEPRLDRSHVASFQQLHSCSQGQWGVALQSASGEHLLITPVPSSSPAVMFADIPRSRALHSIHQARSSPQFPLTPLPSRSCTTCCLAAKRQMCREITTSSNNGLYVCGFMLNACAMCLYDSGTRRSRKPARQ